MEEIYYVEDFQEKILNMEQYFKTLGDALFLKALHHFENGEGFGIEYTCCYFAIECEPSDEEYFGESGVNFTTIPPVTRE